MKESDLPEKERTLWLKALSAIELKNYSYAINLLLPVVKEIPEFFDGRKMLRMSEIEDKKGKKKLFSFSKGGLSNIKIKGLINKETKKAMSMLEDNLVQEPFDIDTNQLLYQCAMILNMSETAAFALETIKKGHPKNTKIMHQLAEHFMAQDESTKASKIYNEILRIDSSDLEANKGAKDADARASMKKNKMESGNFRDWIKDKNVTEQLEESGRAGMTKEQMQEKLERLNEKFETDSENFNLAQEIASLCEQLEDYENAVNFYKWAYNLSGNDSSLEKKIIKAENKLEKSLIDELKKEIEESEGMDADQREEKEQKLQKLLADRAKNNLKISLDRVKKNPTDPQLRFDLGKAFFESRDFTKAIPELQRCKSNPHLHIKVMLLLGQCYAEKNMLDLAKNELNEAKNELKTMDSTKKQVVYQLGLVYSKMNEKEKSLQQMKEIYQVDYQYRDVAERVENSYAS